MHEEPLGYDPALMNLMLNGQQRRPRADDRRRYRDRQMPRTGITDPESCEDEYQRLLWYQVRTMSLEDLRIEVFRWCTANVTYDYAAAWFTQGASYGDKQLLFKMAELGITPTDTARWWTYTERGPNVTVMSALLSEQVTVQQVHHLMPETTG